MNPLEKARSDAARLLTRRDRTARQLAEKLSPKHSPAVIRQVIGEFEAAGWLDDETVALERARTCRVQRGWGDRKIRLDLRSQGIDATIIDRALDRLNQERPQLDCLQELVRSRVGKAGAPRSKAELKRLYDFCLRRGFEPESVRQALRPFFDLFERQG